MNRQTIVAIVLGIAAVILVGWQLVPALFPQGRPAAPAAPTAAVAPTTSMALLNDDTDEEAEEYRDAYAQLVAQVDTEAMDFSLPSMRNPFRPLVGPGSLVEEQAIIDDARQLAAGIIDDPSLAGRQELNLGYSVQGIIWSDGEPYALVNDQVLGVGEEIELGGIVTAITADTVVFTYEGQSVILYVDREL